MSLDAACMQKLRYSLNIKSCSELICNRSIRVLFARNSTSSTNSSFESDRRRSLLDDFRRSLRNSTESMCGSNLKVDGGGPEEVQHRGILLYSKLPSLPIISWPRNGNSRHSICYISLQKADDDKSSGSKVLQWQNPRIPLTGATEHFSSLLHCKRCNFPIDVGSIKLSGNAHPQDEDSRSSVALEAESARSSDSGSVHSNSIFSWSANSPCENESCQERLHCHIARSSIASNLISKPWYSSSQLVETSWGFRFRVTSFPEDALRLPEFVTDKGGFISQHAVDRDQTAKLRNGEGVALVEKPTIYNDVSAPEGDHLTSANYLASLKCIDLSAPEGGNAGTGAITAMHSNAILIPDCLQEATICDW